MSVKTDIGIIITCVLIVAAALSINYVYPMTYEDAVVTVIDKKESVHFVNRTAMIPVYTYRLIVEHNQSVMVSKNVFDRTHIGDEIMITYKIRNNKIISCRYNDD